MVEPLQDLEHFPVTTQLLLTYKSINCSTAFYITYRDCTVVPVFPSTPVTIPCRLKYFCKLWYTAVQSLLF